MYHGAVRKWLGVPGFLMQDRNDDRSCLFLLMAHDITPLLNTAGTGYITCVIFSCRM